MLNLALIPAISLILGAPPVGPSCALDTARQTVDLSVAGVTRSFIIDPAKVPPSAAHRAPLVFVFHGFGASAASTTDLFDAHVLWPKAVVIRPLGALRTFEQFGGRERAGWQVRAGEFGDRDLKFFDAMMTWLDTSKACVDKKRVFVGGFSNGAIFSHLLACARAETVRAVAAVGGAGPQSVCAEPTPVFIGHGLADKTLAYGMGRGSFLAWKQSNVCMGGESPPKVAGCVSATECDEPLMMCAHSGAHVWPKSLSQQIVSFWQAL